MAYRMTSSQSNSLRFFPDSPTPSASNLLSVPPGIWTHSTLTSRLGISIGSQRSWSWATGSSRTLKGTLDASKTLLVLPAEQVVSMYRKPRSLKDRRFACTDANPGTERLRIDHYSDLFGGASVAAAVVT